MLLILSINSSSAFIVVSASSSDFIVVSASSSCFTLAVRIRAIVVVLGALWSSAEHGVAVFGARGVVRVQEAIVEQHGTYPYSEQELHGTQHGYPEPQVWRHYHLSEHVRLT